MNRDVAIRRQLRAASTTCRCPDHAISIFITIRDRPGLNIDGLADIPSGIANIFTRRLQVRVRHRGTPWTNWRFITAYRLYLVTPSFHVHALDIRQARCSAHPAARYRRKSTLPTLGAKRPIRRIPRNGIGSRIDTTPCVIPTPMQHYTTRNQNTEYDKSTHRNLPNLYSRTATSAA